MQTLHSIEECAAWRGSIKGSLGFVPTMGALHRGHLSLVKISKKNCNKTIVSIFVNPAQFSENEDFNSYPCTINEDLKRLAQEKVDAVFMPTKNQLYKNQNSEYFYDTPLSTKLEGIARPHFFKGVTMIVSKLFNIIKPSHTIFGEKDAQQLLIITKMIRNNALNIQIIPGKTIRNKNGLALSSRNSYLSKKEQQVASNIYKGLMEIKELLENNTVDAKILKKHFSDFLNSFDVFQIDYVSIANLETLDELEQVNTKTLISTAVFFNGVRLIDNFTYSPST